MNVEFVSILREPDFATGATEQSPFRFEERGVQADCPVCFDYVVQDDHAKVIVYPSNVPIKYLKLRFEGDLSFVSSVYGDQWERSVGDNAALEWRSVMAARALPWFCYVRGDDRTACYGVKTGADCFAYWQIDTHGVTLFLNLTCGSEGTLLKEPLVAAEVVQHVSPYGEDPYQTACAFASQMCATPVLPKAPIFGVNNWYWAYGKISTESVLTETDYLREMTADAVGSPYMILDDGWQLNRTYSKEAYIGGPWLPNDRFPDMQKLVRTIHEKNAKAGLWFRPLLTMGQIPDEAQLSLFRGGQIMDPSHPYTLERVQTDAARIRGWGFDLIKHDFSTFDLFGNELHATHRTGLCADTRKLYDNTRTTATVLKDLYRAVQRGAGEADVIGCNVVGHLSAGIHSVQRVGGDTSGRSFEWTVRNGVNSMMRLPLNGRFFINDPDCAAFTEKVSAEKNLDFLEMCALTSVTTLASVTPNILTKEEMTRIRRIYRMASLGGKHYGIANYEKTALPEVFVSPDGTEQKAFNWQSEYHGARSVLSWLS